MIQNQIFEHNKTGTDFFVGDLHGHYDLLMRGLDRVGFDFNSDRLFAVGDLIDRGPDSVRCVELLNEPWFYSVLGNHEQMLLRGLEDTIVRKLHLRNGGGWIKDCTPEELEALAGLIRSNISLSMTISTQYGTVGVIHAEAPLDWLSLDSPVEEWDRYLWPTEQYHLAITSRSKQIKGIDLVIHGHVNCNYMETGKNQVWIDTILHGGRLTILSTAQAFDAI